MNESKHDHHRHDISKSAGVHPSHRRYWQRAHKDWRFWIGMVLMLAAMIAYVMSDDLAWRPRSEAPPSLSDSVGK